MGVRALSDVTLDRCTWSWRTKFTTLPLLFTHYKESITCFALHRMLRKLHPPPHVTYCKQTSFLSRAALSLGAALLAFSGTAQAANILIVDGSDPADNTLDARSGYSLAQGVANLQAVCFPTDTVDVEATPPADLSGYDQIWDVYYGTIFGDSGALTAAQQAAYTTYLQSGGHLFLMGENDLYANRNASIISLVGTLGGGTLPAAAGRARNFVQTAQAPYNTTPNAITTVVFSAAAAVATSGNGQWMTYSTTDAVGSAIMWPTGTLTNARTGSLAVVFDVNFIQSTPQSDSVNNPQFLQNLCAAVAAGGSPGKVALAESGTRAINQTETIQATVTDGSGNLLPSTTVTFTVTGGPNKGTTGTATTNAKGVATFTYTSSAVGTDTIEATVTINGNPVSNTLDVTWQAGTLTTAGVPTLGEGALAALGLLLAGGAALALRRKTAS